MDPFQSGEVVAMLAEFKLSINDYLKELIHSPVRSLADIIAFNLENPDLVKEEEESQGFSLPGGGGGGGAAIELPKFDPDAATYQDSRRRIKKKRRSRTGVVLKDRCGRVIRTDN
ncbi:hypothetical protein L1049_014708 [Liquidambar formosana]|uniref:Uncharacterized protein n=1 Tax=Liquidambar formosana TaxID=63359 RepID=A0AAP0RXM1_LIQFO